MTNPEPISPVEWTNGMLDELQLAACVFQNAPHWSSPDGIYHYLAGATVGPNEIEPDYIRMSNMSSYALETLYPYWRVGIFSPREATDESTVQGKFTAYFLARNMGMLVSKCIDMTDSAISESAFPETDQLPTDADYQNISTSISHLRDRITREWDEKRQRYAAMTPEERSQRSRDERALKYASYFSIEEQDKTRGALWWGVTVGSMAFTVKAGSGVEALLDVEDTFFSSQESLLAHIHPHSEESQQDFEARYGGRNTKVVRVVPFSTVEYPVDDQEVSDEQRAAFDKLRFNR